MNNNVKFDLEALIEGLLSHVQNNRQNIENTIREYAKMNYINFIELCILLTKDQTKSEGKRQYALVLMKNVIKGDGSFPEFSGFWINVDANIRENLKSHIINNLASDSNLVRNSIGAAISAICEIEFQFGQWFSILDTLDAYSSDENIMLRLSAIDTLKCIMQDVTPKIIPDEKIGLILFSIKKNTEANLPVKIREEALNALSYCIINCKIYMEEANSRTELLKIIFAAMQDPTYEIQVAGYRCLLEIGKYFYYDIAPHINDCMTLTTAYISGLKNISENEERIIPLCLDFWENLCKSECFNISKKFKVVGYFTKYDVELLNVCKRVFELRNENECPDTFQPYMSAECLLSTMSQCCNDGYVQIVTGIVTDWMNSNTQLLIHSALCLLYTVFESNNKKDVCVVMNSTLSMLCEKLKDPIPNIRLATSRIVYKICQKYAYDIDLESLKSLSAYIFNLMKTETDKKVIAYLINSINEVIKKSTGGPVLDFFNSFIKDLLDTLHVLTFNYSNWDQDKKKNVSSVGSNCISTILEIPNENAKNDLQKYLESLFVSLTQYIDGNYENKEVQEAFIEYASGCLSSAIISKNVFLDKNGLSQIYTIYSSLFKKKSYVFAEGLLVISSLFTCKIF